MPSISSDISVKISTLLKSMGKISDGALADAKKKYESNGETPLGLLDYLIEEKSSFNRTNYKERCCKKTS